MSIRVVKRGRPSKSDLAAREVKKPAPRSDAEILTDLTQRFDILSLLTKGTTTKNIRAMVVTGAPGVGKTYTVEQILEQSKVPHEIVRGSLSAINLYMLAYKFRKPGNVVVLDDADSIFNDEEALNILKALCDTSATRKVSYMKEAQQLIAEDIPKSFEFNGAMIFISNLDFQTFVDEGRNKYAQHFEALMSRSLYLDLRLHNRDELGVWVNHIAQSGRIFDRENVPQNLRQPILSFINTHRNNLRELSIRTLMKTCQLAKGNPSNWEVIATGASHEVTENYMAKLYNPTISKQTKRQTPRMVGYYTTPEAAEQLGVDPATLRYRRDSADAKAYWDLLGVTANDDINELLARSHTIYNGHHYYEQKKFDKFVKLYLKRPEVIRARKRFTTFPTTHTELLTHTITNEDDIKNIKYVIDRMFKAEVKNLTVTLSVTP